MRLTLVLATVLGLSACSGGGSAGSIGSLNPFTWFGGGSRAGSPESLAPRNGYTQAVDYRTLVAEITTVSVERTPGGVIVRATGLPSAVGYHNAGLVAVPSNNARELAFEFRVSPPTETAIGGSAYAREITAATFISEYRAFGVRTVRVTGARNSRTARR